MQVKPQLEYKRRKSLNGNYELGYELGINPFFKLNINNYKINSSFYSILLTGKGASGSVCIAEDRRSGKYVAIKLMAKEGLGDDQLVRMRREYVVHFLCTFKKKKTYP